MHSPAVGANKNDPAGKVMSINLDIMPVHVSRGGKLVGVISRFYIFRRIGGDDTADSDDGEILEEGKA
ncbi:MAG: hypothetical protein ACE5GH_03890 [Fidelibacterota bacterium]